MRVRFSYLLLLTLCTFARAEIPPEMRVMATGLSLSKAAGFTAWARVGERCSQRMSSWGARKVGNGRLEWSYIEGKVSCESNDILFYRLPSEYSADLAARRIVHTSPDGTRTNVAFLRGVGGGGAALVIPRRGSRIEVDSKGARFYFRDLPVAEGKLQTTFEELHGVE